MDKSSTVLPEQNDEGRDAVRFAFALRVEATPSSNGDPDLRGCCKRSGEAYADSQGPNPGHEARPNKRRINRSPIGFFVKLFQAPPRATSPGRSRTDRRARFQNNPKPIPEKHRFLHGLSSVVARGPRATLRRRAGQDSDAYRDLGGRVNSVFIV